MRVQALIRCAAILFLAVLALPCRSAQISGVVRPPNKGVEVVLGVHAGGMGKLPPGTMMCIVGQVKPDATGKFKFEKVPSGIYNVWVEYGEGRSAGKRIKDIKVEKEDKDIGVIELEAVGWVTGHVVPPGDDVSITLESREVPIFQTDKLGNFEIDGLELGKHTLVFERPGFGATLEVDIREAREYQLPEVKLSPMARITGTVTIKGSPLVEYTPPILNSVSAEKVGATASARDSGATGPDDFDPHTGAYVIRDVPPGRYNLSIYAFGVAVMAVDGLPKDKPDQPADTAAVKAVVQTLCKAVTKGDVGTIHKMAVQDAADDLRDFLSEHKQFLARISEPSFVLVRVCGPRAVIYTRAMWKKQGELDGDVVDKWGLVRTPDGWRLSFHAWEDDLGEALSQFRLYAAAIQSEAHAATMPSGRMPPHVKLIITDDPKLTNIEIKSGEVSSGHDWVLELP